MDAKTLFNEKLPGELSSAPEKAKDINAIYVFNVTGDGGGTWTLDLKSDPPTVAEGDGEGDCKIEISNEDFTHLLADPQQNGMQLFFEGKLKVEGDPTLATKLAEVLALQQ